MRKKNFKVPQLDRSPMLGEIHPQEPYGFYNEEQRKTPPGSRYRKEKKIFF
jgi:hypothetical protein